MQELMHTSLPCSLSTHVHVERYGSEGVFTSMSRFSCMCLFDVVVFGAAQGRTGARARPHTTNWPPCSLYRNSSGVCIHTYVRDRTKYCFVVYLARSH